MIDWLIDWPGYWTWSLQHQRALACGYRLIYQLLACEARSFRPKNSPSIPLYVWSDEREANLESWWNVQYSRLARLQYRWAWTLYVIWGERPAKPRSGLNPNESRSKMVFCYAVSRFFLLFFLILGSAQYNLAFASCWTQVKIGLSHRVMHCYDTTWCNRVYRLVSYRKASWALSDFRPIAFKILYFVSFGREESY